MLLVHLDGDAPAVVLDGDGIVLGVDGHVHPIHVGIALLVVGGIDQDLVKDFVETGRVRDGAFDDPAGVGVEHEHGLGGRFGRADVGVGTEEDVFELRLLLVNLLDALLLVGRGRRLFGLGGSGNVLDAHNVIVAVEVGEGIEGGLLLGWSLLGSGSLLGGGLGGLGLGGLGLGLGSNILHELKVVVVGGNEVVLGIVHDEGGVAGVGHIDVGHGCKRVGKNWFDSGLGRGLCFAEAERKCEQCVVWY